MNAVFRLSEAASMQTHANKTLNSPKRRKPYLVKLAQAIEERHQRHKNHCEHLSLEDYLLQDIGRTRMEVEFESD
jgi:uncharacterized protein YjiS (DUF1127 family)